MSDEDGSERSNPHAEHVKSIIADRQNVRLGPYPGAGPGGAQLLSYDQLPDDREALKHLYLELQRTLQDMEAKHHREKERLRWGGEDSLEDLLNRFWWRAWELIFIVSVLSFLIPILTSDIFSQTQQVVGIIVLTALWERYLRNPIHSIGQAIDNRYLP